MNDHFEEINIHSIESAAVYGIDLLSFDLVVDDGLIKKALISNSFLNRKIQELSFPQSLKLYTLAFEKIDYDYSQYYSHAFVSTLEDLLSQSVSERTKQIRRLILEQSTIYGLLTFSLNCLLY